MSDPTVLYDVTEQVREALVSAPVLGWTGDRNYDVAATHAASTALYEVADILRERAEVYAEQGKHEAARALLDEADRLAERERVRPHCP
jgi:ribonuclease HI